MSTSKNELERDFEAWRKGMHTFFIHNVAEKAKNLDPTSEEALLKKENYDKCVYWKNELFKTSILFIFACPIVRFMSESLQKVGCIFKSENISCVECEEERTGGFSPDFGIELCCNKMPAKEIMQDTLVHEMVHAYDHCKFNVDWFNLQHHACSEIRAANLSGDCAWIKEAFRGNVGFIKHHQVCVKRRAILAVSENPMCTSKEDAKYAVNKVFKSCFNDTQPQLRDVIHCPFPENRIYSIYKQNIEKYDISARMSQKIIKNLPFDPVSLSINKQYIAVGGQKGELAIANQSNTSDIKIIQLSDSINNFMCFESTPNYYENNHYLGIDSINNSSADICELYDTERNSSIDSNISIFDPDNSSVVSSYNDTDSFRNRLLVCTNDKSIKIVSLPSLSVDHEIYFDTSINNASISPDRSKMIAVGDTNQVFVFNKRGSDYEKIATITGIKNIIILFLEIKKHIYNSRKSDVFAIASQDGHVSIWDIRMNRKINSLESVQSGRACGACRNVKFSKNGPVDLMAFSEHSSYVTVVDSRHFNKKQLLKTNTELGESQITGIEFSYDSEKLFVGLEGCILDYKVDTLKRRCFPYFSVM
ncbi:hypothetical protein BB561_002926 [Smittium simulii]|uniref:Mitochondrial inner membrane protease ATP23 n=1 Tax=Smittium simulii TaxID=133385 RepID=A0A2T9YNK7_9FUNG|nr:hypothetical protein BB561_002926 [Smittium simulii]